MIIQMHVHLQTMKRAVMENLASRSLIQNKGSGEAVKSDCQLRHKGTRRAEACPGWGLRARMGSTQRELRVCREAGMGKRWVCPKNRKSVSLEQGLSDSRARGGWMSKQGVGLARAHVCFVLCLLSCSFVPFTSALPPPLFLFSMFPFFLPSSLHSLFCPDCIMQAANCRATMK